MRTRIQKFSTPLTVVIAGCAGKVNWTIPLFSPSVIAVNAFVASLKFVSLAGVVVLGLTCPSGLQFFPSQNSQFNWSSSGLGEVPGARTLIFRTTTAPSSENASLFDR